MPTRLLLALVTVFSLLGAACGDDGDSTGDGSTFPDVGTMAAALDDAGLPCTLEYEGLDDGTRQVSLCAVRGEFTELSVWADPSDAVAATERAAEAGDPFVGGANWTVDVETAATATEVAGALGGTAVGG